MNTLLSKTTLAAVALFVVAGLTLPPALEAAPRGGGGARGGGGGSQGGGAKAAQANNSRTDARANNVRSTSVNNVNVNKNVNVNVDNNHGCCNNGWDNDHPVATVAAVTATVAVTSAVVGSMVRSVPPNCVPVNYGGIVYQQCGSTWYQPQNGQYVVINAPY